MGMEGCTNVNKSDFLSKSEKKHEEYCKFVDPATGERRGSPTSWNPCSKAEGCIWEDGECKLNVGGSLSNAYINGGFGFGKLCLSKEFTRLIILIIFPPAYVIINENETGFKNKGAIIMSFVMTCLFYFPGLIYTLMYKHRR
tara:strand:+ start:82 stop:507 length:426 start_codon:yes stop_codon:yes gene_type:complete